MKAMEKIKLSKERVNLIADLKSGNLKGLAKIKASKRVVEIVVLLGGEDEPTAVQKTFPSTKSIVNSTDDLAQRIATLKEKRDFLLSEMKRVGQRYDGSTKIVSTALADAKAKGWMSESTLNAIQNTRLVKSNSTANSAFVAEVEGALIFLANDSDAKRDLRLSQQQERDETLARQADEDRLAAEKATAEKQENDRKAAAYFDLYGFDEDQIISLSYKGVLAQIRKAKASGNADSVKSADQAYRRVQQNIVEMTDLLQEIADGTKSKADFFDWSGSQYFPNVADILNGIDTSKFTIRTSNQPLYQSVLDGAEVTIELVKQVRAEGQKDPDHPQLRPAVRVIVETVKAMAA
jgi:hypothetical protein